jgi:aspartate/methionine/tyrosine aminotransferase
MTRLQPFSSRFRWNLQSNPLNDLLETKRRRGAAILDLTESNPTVVGLDYPEQEILQALHQPPALRYQPHPRGLLIARQAVADYYRERGEAVAVEQIHLTTSTSEGYGFLFKLLTDPGDHVLVPQPSYPLLEFLAGLEAIDLQPYSLLYRESAGWEIDLDSLAAAINERTRAIVIVNPNNPTGSYVKRDELAELAGLCKQRGPALIFDEVFFDYTFKSPLEGGKRGVFPLEVGTRWPQSGTTVTEVLSFVLSGISKILGLPQMKLGWIVVNGPDALRKPAQEYLDLIADTYLSVSAPIQHALPQWLRLWPELHQKISERVSSNLHWLSAALKNDSRLQLLKLEGGWYATLAISNLDSEEQLVLSLLEKENVLVHPGFFFDFPCERYLVLSLLPAPDIFREGVSRLLAQLNVPGALEVPGT